MMPRKGKVTYIEGFKRNTAAKIHFKAFLPSVDKWLANRQSIKVFCIKILRYRAVSCDVTSVALNRNVWQKRVAFVWKQAMNWSCSAIGCTN